MSGVLTSCDGFQDASKIITRFAATKLIPKPPALVEIKNSLKNIQYFMIFSISLL